MFPRTLGMVAEAYLSEHMLKGHDPEQYWEYSIVVWVWGLCNCSNAESVCVFLQ